MSYKLFFLEYYNILFVVRNPLSLNQGNRGFACKVLKLYHDNDINEYIMMISLSCTMRLSWKLPRYLVRYKLTNNYGVIVCSYVYDLLLFGK